MSFLTFPLLLGGIIAAIAPILLHLIMRGIPKQLEFPALRFLQRKRKLNKRKFRLRHLLLLLLRIGVFVLIAFALARPSVRWDGSGSAASSLVNRFGSQAAPIAAAIVIDNSPRMDYQIANKTRLELAKSEARWVLSQLPPDSEIAVLSNTRMNDTFQVDLFSAVERIEHLSLNFEGRSVGESVAAALRLLKSSELETREIYVFTDLTVPSWPEEYASSVRNELGEIGVYLVDLGVEEPHNTGIVKLDLSGEVLSTQSSLELSAEVTHYGNPDERLFELVMIENDGSEQRRLSEIVTFTEGHAVRNLQFTLPNLLPGVHQGVVRATTSDAFAVDDRFFFTVEVQPSWKILLVAPDPVAKHSLFFREAIDPSVFRKRGGSSFQTETMSFEQWKAMPDSRWDEFRAIALLDPGPLDAALWKKLADYVSTGHGVGVFLGRKANPVRAFQSDAAVEFLGTKPLRHVRASDDADFFLAPNDLLSPILRDFRPLGDVDQVPWSLQPVFCYWELGELSPQAHAEIRYSDGRPAIVTRPLGRGNVVFMSTPLSDPPNENPWNFLPVSEDRWVFILLAEGISRLLVGAGERTYNYGMGQMATIPIPEGTNATNVLLMLPDGNTAKVQPNLANRQLSFGATDQPGNYRLRLGGAQGAPGGFSVNVRKTQLDFTRVASSVLDGYFGEKKYRIAKNRNEIEIVVARGRTGSELYPLLILCACAMFFGEYLFSNRFYRA